jgi:hypothetical protein
MDDFQLSLSIGAAEWHNGQTLDEALDSAGRNMYGQKTRKTD